MVALERHIPIFKDRPQFGSYRFVFERQTHSPTLSEEVRRYREYVNASPLRGEIAQDMWAWSPNAQSHASLLLAIRAEKPFAYEEGKFTILSFDPTSPSDEGDPHIRVHATTKDGLQKTLAILRANISDLDAFDVEITSHPLLAIYYRGGLGQFSV